MKRNGNAEDEAPRSRAAGARIEAPRGWAWGGGVPLPTGGRGLGRRRAPPEKKKLTLALNMVNFGAFWMVFFYSSATCFKRKTGLQQCALYN